MFGKIQKIESQMEIHLDQVQQVQDEHWGLSVKQVL
jgi:hypothetical protein